MIVERLPNVLALPVADKELLAEELLGQVLLESESDPALLAMLRDRLLSHADDPAAGVRWEDLRGRLLKN